jgi:glycosyltransferase involved in cell wall biosynthesis
MLQWMWQHPAERRAMGLAARRRVIAHFTDDLMARRYSELYGRLLSGCETSLAGLGNHP